MVLKALITLIFSVSAAIFYRMGGSGNYSRLWRRLGIPLIAAVVASIWGMYHWSLFFCIGLMFGALTTYWDFVNYPLGVKDPESERWWNWFLHGFFVSLAMFPIAIALDLCTGLWIRSCITGVLMMAWSEFNGNAVWEENGRGFISIATIPLLLI